MNANVLRDRISILWGEALETRKRMKAHRRKEDALELLRIQAEADAIMDVLYEIGHGLSLDFDELENKEIHYGWKDAREILGLA